MQGQLDGEHIGGKVGTYGSVEGLEEQRGRDVDNLPGKKHWHDFGSPSALLMASFTNLGRQCVALGVILLSVFFSHEYLMTCDSRKVGFAGAAACEYTKAYVRCFPLLALLVALMVSCRQILLHRMYYEMLKFGILLDIENFFPLHDPLFLIVTWCALNATAHFVLTILAADGARLDTQSVQAEMMKISGFYASYLIPTGLFLAFLFSGYDLEATLLPLNKYFEEDPDEARKALGQMPFLEEPAVAAAVSDLNEQGTGPSRNLGEAMRQLTKIAEAKMTEAKDNPDSITPLGKWRLMGCSWSSSFLLHPNRVDRESINFKHVWYVVGVFYFCVILIVLYFFVKTTMDKIHDVASGQGEDSFGIVVTFAHAWLAFLLAVSLSKNIPVGN